MSEALELAKLIAFAQRPRHDVSRDAEEFWDNTGYEGRVRWLTSAQVVLAAGFHRGPKLPAEGTPEEDAAVERMAKSIHSDRFEDDDDPDDNDEGMARAALRALRGNAP